MFRRDRADAGERAGTDRPPPYEQYLLRHETVVLAVHRHWITIVEPIASAVFALLLALSIDASSDRLTGPLANVMWWVCLAVVARMVFLLLDRRQTWFVATDRRLLLIYGLVTRRVAMMPLIKVTDMSYDRSPLGQMLGYGKFVMESAGQEQALREVTFIPQPARNYHLICDTIFGSEDAAEGPGPGAGPGGCGWGPEGDDWDPPDGDWPDPDGPVTGHDGGDDWGDWGDPPRPRHRPRTSEPPDRPTRRPSGRDPRNTTGIPLYRSEDLRARERVADTGPIPVEEQRRAARRDPKARYRADD